MMTRFEYHSSPAVRGFLHRPDAPSGDALILAHGAGSDSTSPLLVTMAETFAEAGFTVLRCDLPYRQERPHGPPFPSEAARDQDGLRNALLALGSEASGNSFRRMFLGGHSYGGRQATMLAAEHEPLTEDLAGLFLLSYPLHPPGQPDRLRTAHFPALRSPALFVSGSRDPFGTLQELGAALRLIPAPTHLLAIEGGGHSLLPASRRRGAVRGRGEELSRRVLETFVGFFGRANA